jgi:hypothetical protein
VGAAAAARAGGSLFAGGDTAAHWSTHNPRHTEVRVMARRPRPAPAGSGLGGVAEWVAGNTPIALVPVDHVDARGVETLGKTCTQDG